jgi:acyl-CoA dehydrogenase
MSVTRPWMNEELSMLRDASAKFFQRECVPHYARWAEQQHADRDIWQKAGAAGLLCASVPTQYGGGGGNFLHEAVICEEQVNAMVGAFSNSVHSGIVAHYLLEYGSEAQKLRWLPRMASGELVAAIAMTEPSAGTDLQRIKTIAKRVGDEYLVSGTKIFITNGFHANLICLAVKTDAAAGAKGVSLLMVEVDNKIEHSKGFQRGKLLDKVGQKTLDAVELFFDEMPVPVENLLGQEEGKGFAQLMQQLPKERMIIALGSVTTMHRAIEETRNYVRQREVFGQPLMAMQNTRFKLAECLTQATVARSFVDDCIARLMRGELDGPTSAMAKWWTTDTNCRIVDECLQLFGGYGYMNEYPIARLYADVRVGKIYGGANEVMKEIIARSMDK